MSFNYDIANDIGKIRFEVHDVTSGAGVFPDGTNLTDEEIQYVLTREGSVGCAAAGVCEALARAWATMANISVGSRNEQLAAVADQWTKQAKLMRESFGGDAAVFSVDLQRDDGYHQFNPRDADAGGWQYAGRIVYVRT